MRRPGPRLARMMRVALAGFGSSGQTIHAPLLDEAGCDVVAVSTSDSARADAARAEFPGTEVVPRLDDLLAVPGVDLVVLATPSGGHAAQVRAVVDAGIACLVDKPLAVDAAEAAAVVEVRRGRRGAAHGVPQPALRPRAGHGRPGGGRRSRRHPVPLRDALGAVATGAQGPLAREGQREPRAAASCSTCTATSSTRRCSCSGRSTTVFATVDARTTRAEDDAFLVCRHTTGVVVAPRGDLAVRGSGPAGPAARHRGGVRHGRLHRRAARVERARPTPTPAHSGWLYRGDEREPVARGATTQADLYRAVSAALESADPQAAMPVDPWDAVHTLAVIDAARVSAAEERVVAWRPRRADRHPDSCDLHAVSQGGDTANRRQVARSRRGGQGEGRRRGSRRSSRHAVAAHASRRRRPCRRSSLTASTSSVPR